MAISLRRGWLAILCGGVLFLAACSSGTTARPGGPTPTLSAANAVWVTLGNKPLHFPTVKKGAACPVSTPQGHISPDYALVAGAGPVYFVAISSKMILPFSPASSFGDPGSQWGGAKSYWEIAPAYTGPVLVRGQRLDGAGAVRFNGGLAQTRGNSQGTEPLLNTLQLVGGVNGAGQWAAYVTFTRLQVNGCYGFQVDGLTFSEIIVFTAQSQ